ncbi:MAG: 3D-(3,5/4)-trihydroxycyclohexane-1,2-dione acylhydrolase (decyclizing) [SAR324 cluster bacterium]|nr:3D-(3,5/4)-trihydroxycyclohexane-1,2-dione acylhydrolase (decyclizing) [SAR324 cluster bacterium]
MNTIRLTTAQAIVRYLSALKVKSEEGSVPLFGGVFAIFGHGNVAGIGEALFQYRDQLPTYRAHNEQAMAHTAIAYAKSQMRRRMMAVTTSIGPGATNLVTAAALAHVNRLPVLLLPGDIFVSRAPDPVLQQVENFGDGTISANDCFRPVSRYFDRIVYPQQLLTALPRALQVLTDQALCGPVTLALPQDVQTIAWDFPEEFFAPPPVEFRVPAPLETEIEKAAELLRQAKQPLIIAGGGVLYSEASDKLKQFSEKHGVPVAETQAGKSSLAWNHPLQLGAIGVTGSTAANAQAQKADVVLAVGTRLQDFTTGSNSLFTQARVISINANGFDALKSGAITVASDAGLGLQTLSETLSDWQSSNDWQKESKQKADEWNKIVETITQNRNVNLPYDGEVIGVVQSSSEQSDTHDIAVGAAGTLPGELHKLWRTVTPGAYHMEYGYSCMGYEIAGGIGVKMAHPDREVIVMVGDGSYLMMNSEIATSVMLGCKLIIIVLDNRGFGCINRLQQASGGEPFNNLLENCVQGNQGAPAIDFAAHAKSLGALAENVSNISEMEPAMQRARNADQTYLICIETDPNRTTEEGGCWWEVAIPEISPRKEVLEARIAYEQGKQKQKA